MPGGASSLVKDSLENAAKKQYSMEEENWDFYFFTPLLEDLELAKKLLGHDSVVIIRDTPSAGDENCCRKL